MIAKSTTHNPWLFAPRDISSVDATPRHETRKRRVMRAVTRVLSVLLLISQSGCGATPRYSNRGHGASQKPPTAALPSGVVAQVGDETITHSMLDHLTDVEAVLTSEPKPGRRVPPGVVPDPPAYRKCIAYIAKTSGTTPKPDAALLRVRCAYKRRTLQEQALSLLIIHRWVSVEAATHGVTITTRELLQARRRLYPASVDQRFLDAAGVHRADERFVVETQLLHSKLAETVLPAYARLRRSHFETLQLADEIDAEVGKLDEELTRNWGARTHCRTGYIVLQCARHGA